ncbi:MAG: oligosaccharide flippase family protein [Ferruginibacter sp.]
MAAAPKYNSWLIAGLYNGLQKLSIPLFGVASTMILAHGAITKAEMGVWALFLLVTSFVELIRQALVKTSLIKFINHSSEEEHKYVLSAALFLNVLITLALLIVLFFLAPYLSRVLKAPELKQMLYIFLAGILLLIPFSHFEWIMYGKSQFKGLFWTFFYRQGISLLLMIIYLFLYKTISLNMLVIFYCAGILLGIAIAYNNVKRHLSRTFILSKVWIKKLWHFGKYVFGSGLSTLVFGSAGQVFHSSLMGLPFAASNSVASRVINLADIPSQVLSDILFPKSAKKENTGNKELIKYYYEKTVGATLCFNIPMVLFIILFPKFIILVLAGDQYLDAVPFLQWIAITGIFLAFLKQWGVIIDSSGRPQLNFLIITLIAAVHVILTYIGIVSYGFLGAAYALVCSHIFGFIITQWLLYRMYNIQFLNCFRYAIRFYPELSKILLDKLHLKWKAL